MLAHINVYYIQWRNGRVSGCPVTGGPQTLGAPDKNDHKKFDSTFLGFLGFLEKCFNFGEKYHISGKFLGVSVKFFSYLGKIGVCPEKFFDSQNGTLTENFFGDGGDVCMGPKVAEKGPRHKICLRAPCSSVTLLAIVKPNN
jgi:hypothetical protein